MLTGKLWLDFDTEGDEDHWGANVDRAIVRDDEILLEFSGHHPDEGAFVGQCKLKKQGAIYSGEGSFTMRGKKQGAGVSASRTNEKYTISLAGTWHDTGDSSPYELSVELNVPAG